MAVSSQRAYLQLLVLVLVVLCLFTSFLLYDSGTDPHDSTTVERLRSRLQERENQLDLLSRGNTGSLRGGEATPPTGNGVAFGFRQLSRGSPGFNGTKLHEDLTATDDALVRELLFRRNTRYWLETKPEWPVDPIPPRTKFVTFSPWRGGFNNIRMSLEMAVAFAAATDRTLVMPPEMNMYLRGKSSLTSYFDYEDLRRGISVVTYDEFYDLVDFGRFQHERPNARQPHSTVERYYEGLSKMPGVYNTKEHWSTNRIGGDVVYCVPNCPDGTGSGLDKNAHAEYKWFQKFAAHGHKYNMDDPTIADARIVHFPQNLLGHFYTMFYFRDSQRGRRVRRIVRDHVHFREDIIEMAERIINKLQDFKFSCLHIRRNEFQFKDAWTDAETIVANTKRLFSPDELIYISTDELSDEKEHKQKWSDPKAMVTVAKHTWFQPMKDEWGANNVLFLSDFYDDLLQGVPDIYLGCIETIICSRARVFVGTRKSTFSGYIHRLRGYMHDVGQKMIFDAQSVFPYDYYEYFSGPQWSKLQGAYGRDARHPYWGREYKDAWEGVYNPLA